MNYIITAGSAYLDIDAYACSVAMRELLSLKGKNSVAYSNAAYNYSISPSLIHECDILKEVPVDFSIDSANYIIVDVSDPGYLSEYIPLERVIEVYDHHVGFEDYWQDKIGKGAHIEFIGAAATLIYREWKKAKFQDKMSRHTAELLVAAILDNTLYLTSSNTPAEDIQTFENLCEKANIGEEWCAAYFSDVQKSVEADLKNALFNDIKRITDNNILPSRMAQLCVWDAKSIIEKLPQIRQYFDCKTDWMLNIIDIKHHCSHFVCEEPNCQRRLVQVFGVNFDDGVAKTNQPYLRKQIIKGIIQST